MTPTAEQVVEALRRQLARAERDSEHAGEARRRLDPGTSRARVTTANARWMRNAEHRDRVAKQLSDALEGMVPR